MMMYIRWKGVGGVYILSIIRPNGIVYTPGSSISYI